MFAKLRDFFLGLFSKKSKKPKTVADLKSTPSKIQADTLQLAAEDRLEVIRDRKLEPKYLPHKLARAQTVTILIEKGWIDASVFNDEKWTVGKLPLTEAGRAALDRYNTKQATKTVQIDNKDEAAKSVTDDKAVKPAEDSKVEAMKPVEPPPANDTETAARSKKIEAVKKKYQLDDAGWDALGAEHQNALLTAA